MLVAVVALLYLFPLGSTAEYSSLRFLFSLMTQMLIFGLLALSFDMQLGRAGLLNFGHVALFGIGAYVMAFTLNWFRLPPPFDVIVFPLAIFVAMAVASGIGLIMGATTNRLRGTAFAFIALAISMLIYNYFVEHPDISGGDTGLGVSQPALFYFGPALILFVLCTLVMLAAFFGMSIQYLKNRTDPIGLPLFVIAMMALVGYLLVFTTNLIGPGLVSIAVLGIIALFWYDKKRVVRDPLQFSETELTDKEGFKFSDFVRANMFTIILVVLAVVGVLLTFLTNIASLLSNWILGVNTTVLRIPILYYFVLTCVVIAYLLVRRLVSSPFGRMVIAVAQNEERAEALGYDSYRSKIMIVMISGAIAGLAGALYAPFIRIIGPDSALGVGITIDAMLYSIIGGIGTLIGPLFGTGVVIYLEHILGGELWLVIMGVIYIAIVLFLPLGIIGSIRSRSYNIRQRLQRLKVGRFEFSIRDTDYWIFALLALIGSFLMMYIGQLLGIG
jgi:ABC-type branched-subunit amino acid transport system permease subunit